jgi:antitoxin (DNA-binding transcriptional repressor) of toxin-antitoxin stability system
MRTVDIRTAKAHLARRLDQVAAGEESAIAPAGQPFAWLAGDRRLAARAHNA